MAHGFRSVFSNAIGSAARLTIHNTIYIRFVSMSLPCQATRGPIKLRSTASNLQTTKHIKYSEEFIRKEIQRYKLSTRRLANMMGENPDSFGPDDVKRAVKYLFPSDLDEDSLPSMDHPAKVYTTRLKVHWDENKKPFHYLYYTGRPNAYQLLHDAYQRVLNCRKVNTTITRQEKINLEGTRWMTMEEMSTELLDSERLSDAVYNQIVAQLEKLLEEEHSYIAKDFIMKHRKPIPKVTMMDNILEAEVMDDGRKYVEEVGQKKSAIAKVKLIHPGTGVITINDREFHKHFRFLQDRRTVLSPFCLLDQLGLYDVEAVVTGGITHPESIGNRNAMDDPKVPSASQASAIRLAISRAMRSFITAQEVETLRRAGLLTFDKRWKERKVFGQHKARKKHTWKRR